MRGRKEELVSDLIDRQAEHGTDDFGAEYKRTHMIVFDGAACIYCDYLKEDTLSDSAVQKEMIITLY